MAPHSQIVISWRSQMNGSERVQANDFGSEVIPGAQAMGKHIQAYLFDGYWEDIGTIEAFYQSNLALTDHPKPAFRLVPSVPASLSVCRPVLPVYPLISHVCQLG